MPTGTHIIFMRSKYPKFTAHELSNKINEYFIYIKGTPWRSKRVNAKGTKKYTYTKVRDRDEEPATISGLALFIGFISRQNFDEYRQKGTHAHILNQGCLRIEAVYEKRLHEHYTSGPIFALKSLGWNDNKNIEPQIPASLNVHIIEGGPQTAASEKEVNTDN